MKITAEFDKINLKKLIDHAYIGVVIHQLDSSVVYANPTALKLLRLSFEQIIGKDAMDPQWHFLDEFGRKLPVEEYPVNRVLKWKQPIRQEVLGVIDSSGGDTSWFMIDAYIELDKQSEFGFVVVTFSDITDKKTDFSYFDVVEHAQDVIIVTDAESLEAPIGPKIVYVNKAFENLTGYSTEEVIGETPRMLQGKFTDKETTDRIKQSLIKKEPIRETILNYGKDGHPYWLDMIIIPLTNRLGQVTHFAAIERDVTEQKFYAEQLEKRNKDLRELKNNLQDIVDKQTAQLREANLKLERIAYFDVLTDLPNRRYFQDQLAKQIAYTKRHKLTLMFGIADLDDFKRINDTYGHATGDQALGIAAQVFKSIFRREDAYGRMGGEEFVFAVQVKTKRDVESICRKLVQQFAKISVPIENGESMGISASIGAHYEKVNEETTAESLYKKADQALYQAKAAGKKCFRIFKS